LIAFAALAASAIVAYGFVSHGGWTSDGATAAARWTARFSFLWFVTAWSASAIARLWPGGWRSVLLRRRRALGLSFAAAHFVHLIALLIAVFVFARESSVATIYGGGFGYVLVAAMALTSNDAAVRALGPARWKLLHAFGGYVIAAIFAVSYYGRLETKPLLAFVTLGLLGIAVALRLAAWGKRFSAKRPAPVG
jgi:DMSO/TMAO reductase YedYZ heme-binding membrane subunit